MLVIFCFREGFLVREKRIKLEKKSLCCASHNKRKAK